MQFCCILAHMAKHKLQKKEKYLRLLTLFEQNLRTYHPIFQHGNYEMSYNISNFQFPNDYVISVELITRLTSSSSIMSLKKESLHKVFASYCNYFSITDFKIVRPFDRMHRIDSLFYESIPISKRITLSHYTNRIIRGFLDEQDLLLIPNQQ